MPRAGVTQTRTWTYDAVTTNLTSETQPESGTTCYTYAADLVATKTDANLSVTTYTYDPYGRATTIARARQGQAPDPCQSTHYLYDVNPNHPNTANAWGRLAASYTGDLDGSGLPLCTVQTLNGAPTNQVFEEGAGSGAGASEIVDGGGDVRCLRVAGDSEISGSG
jgi:YD repeat-containing protein